LLALRRDLGAVLDRLRVLLAVLLRFIGELPVAPAIESLDHSDLRRRIFLVVTDLDLESFVHPFVIGVDSEAGAAALANQNEAVAGIDPHGFVTRRVINSVLAGKLELAIVITALKTQPPSRQRHPQS